MRDITRGKLTDEEAEALFEAFLGDNPIVAAILGQCMVEYELDKLIRFTMKKTTDAKWDELTEHDAPLGTFGRKITMAAALGLISDETKSKLRKIGVVRNQFAHAKRLVDFSDPRIAMEMRGAQFSKGEAEAGRRYRLVLESESPKACLGAYQQLCQLAAIALIKRHTRGLTAASKNMARAVQRRTAPNPFALKPGGGLFGQRIGLGGLLGAYRATKSADPTSPAPGDTLSALLGKYGLAEIKEI